MLIRCEKCSTTYELDESLIPPGGAPVQCSRCEHVFRAYPPSRRAPSGVAEDVSQPPPPAPETSPGAERRGGLELVPPPANDAPYDAAAPDEAAPAETFEPRPRPTPVPVPPPAPAPTPVPAPMPVAEAPAVPAQRATTPAPVPDGVAGASSRPPAPSTYKPPPGPVIPPGKPVRKVPNPELEGTDVPSVAPVPRRGMTVDVGTRRRGKSSWFVWAAVGLLAFLVVVGTISWWQDQRTAKATAEKSAAAAAASAASRAMTPERQEALKLLMRDDPTSLERAAKVLDEAVRREPASAARADRALALALLSQQAREQAARQEGRARALDDERAHLGDGPDAASRATELATDADAARADVEPLRERAGRLLAEARAELEQVPAQIAGDVSTARARAFVQLAAGERADAARTAHGAAADDPWIALASILAGVPDNAGGDALQSEADRLEQLAAKHPSFVRPLLLAARIRAGLGDGERASADVDAVLKANPQHSEAKRLRAELGPSIPDATGAPAEGAAPAGAGAQPERAKPPSPAVNGRSQRGNRPAPAKGAGAR